MRLTGLLILAGLGVGCAARPPQAGPGGQSMAHAAAPANVVPPLAVAPAADGRAGVPIDQVPPRPVLGVGATPRDSGEPPLQAVRLFAQGRIAILHGRKSEAVENYEKALALDPSSYELHKALGDTYAQASDPRAAEQWEAAADLEPDHLDVHIDLGREYLNTGDLDKSTRHLLLATQTTEYRNEDAADAEADFLLARSLQRQGYDRASLQSYERLLARLKNPRISARSNPQVRVLLLHPDELALHIAALYEKHGQFASAVALLEPAARREPGNFQVQARVVRDLADAGQKQRAVRGAAELVARFRASPESIGLLRQITGDAATTSALQSLSRSHPDDRDLVYALADLLADQHRAAEAMKVLDDAGRRWPDDLRVLRRRVGLLRAAGSFDAAARTLIAALARSPDHDLELSASWTDLVRPGETGRLTVADLQNLSVPADQSAARFLLLARSAELWHRSGIERDALQKAIDARPVFRPAWREMLAFVWADESLDDAEKSAKSRDLADRAARAGDAALADELRGQAALNAHDGNGAAEAFARASQAGDRAPELYLNFAAALHLNKDDRRAQSLLWKVISDHPLAGDAYLELYGMYEKQQSHDQARRVLTVWLNADPEGVAPRRLEAREAFGRRQFTQAERLLLDLLERRDADPDVLLSVRQFYSETLRLEELRPLLEQKFKAEPWNFYLGSTLAEIDTEEHGTAPAESVLDAMSVTFARDPEVLYRIAALYEAAGLKDRNEQVLRRILQVDPAFEGAGNDLGYSWAEQGRNLTQAEALIRRAVASDPQNPSFLDSFGWVLYKLGKFDAALENLSRAARPADRADPVVLNHLGDALYRLGDRRRAAEQWQQALSRVDALHDSDRPDLKPLREQLLRKRQAYEAGRPVDVAPVGAGRPEQANTEH